MPGVPKLGSYPFCMVPLFPFFEKQIHVWLHGLVIICTRGTNFYYLPFYYQQTVLLIPLINNLNREIFYEEDFAVTVNFKSVF